MQLFNRDIETKIQRDIIANVLQGKYVPATKHVIDVLQELYDSIPENKRTSFGRVYTVQVLSRYLFSRLVKKGVNVYEIGKTLFERSKNIQSKGIALGILSFYGTIDYEKVLPFFDRSITFGFF